MDNSDRKMLKIQKEKMRLSHFKIFARFVCGLITLTHGISSQNITYKVGILLMTNSTFPVDLPHVGPAIDKGVEDVESIYGIRFETIFANYSVWCDIARYTAQGFLADMFYRDNVRAFVGPACSYAVETAGRMAEYLRVPMVTGLGDLVTREPAENDMFKTTVILSYNSRKLSGKNTNI